MDGGHALLGGDPVRLFRMTTAGAELVRSWSAGVVVDSSTGPHVAVLIDRLAASGVLHPEADSGSDQGAGLAVVVPVRDRPESLRRCLSALVAASAVPIVVVDDGSSDAASHLSVVAEFADAGQAVSLIRHDVPGGPASARMSGAGAVAAMDSTHGPVEFIAFVDSDVEVESDWLDPLLGLFADPRVGLVAPRVRHGADVSGSRGESTLDRFESARSPLDLGSKPAPIAPNSRVSYVPAAAIIVRRSAFVVVNGFDTSLTVGEDVDLVWRLVDAGWRCQYEPRSEVRHRGRSTPNALLSRRMQYGESAAALDERHRGVLAAVNGSRWSVAVAVAVLSGHPVVAGTLAASSAARLSQKLSALSDRHRVAVRLVAAGHLGFLRQLARAAVRPWFPLTIAVLCARPRNARWLLPAVLWAPLSAWWRDRPALDPMRWTAWWLADDLAYSVGVWRGCLRRRRMGPLGVSGWRDRERQN